MLFEYIDDIPHIPESLLNEIMFSMQNKNMFPFDTYENYKIYPATENLIKFIEPFFSNHSIKVHVIKNALPIHRDIGRKIAYNYLIDAGGENVETCFYADNNDLLHKVKIETGRWHKIDVSTLHNVINLEKNRIALTINPISRRNSVD